MFVSDFAWFGSGFPFPPPDAPRGESPPRATGRGAVPGVVATSGTPPAGHPEVHGATIEWWPCVVQGHRAVSPGEVTKTPHVSTVFWFNPLPGICGSLAVLAGPEAGLAVWVFLRVA